MFKHFILFLFSISFINSHAQTWSKHDIEVLEGFSIKSLKSRENPSNKHLNSLNAIKLGEKVFSDKRFSSNARVSCNSCHIKKNAFTDNKKLAFGLREGFRNTATLLNVGAHDWFFADGAKDSLWAQSLSSIENPAEQNFSRMEVLHLISKDDNYRTSYQQTFDHILPAVSQLELLPAKAGPHAKLKDLIAWKKLTKEQRHETNIVFTNIGKAIAAYVSTIQSKATRFDEFVEDLKNYKNSKILSASEQRGLRLFMSQQSGCANCHSGPLFSNKSFHNISTGIPGKDNGRSEVIESVIRDEFNCLSPYSDAKSNECMELNYINRNKHHLTGAYKTATLRSISKTGPYMHDGRYDNLNEVIKHYLTVSHRVPRNNDLPPITLTEEQQTDLINFLLTL